jgi:hypothetical protein
MSLIDFALQDLFGAFCVLARSAFVASHQRE